MTDEPAGEPSVTCTGKIQVMAAAREARRVRRAQRHLFGRLLTHRELARLVGAPDGSVVRLSTFRQATGLTLNTRIEHDGLGLHATRWIERDADGTLVLHNRALVLGHPRGGIGARLLANQVHQANLLGVDRIVATAVRSPSSNGYYTWAILGFDGPLGPEHQRRLSPRFRDASTVQEIMERPGGAIEWLRNGATVTLSFDPRPGSPHSERLQRYLNRKTLDL